MFGDVLDGADPLECVEVVLVLSLPPQEVPWELNPQGTQWLADRLRLSKGGFAYWWRSHLDPVFNHHIRSPVRLWSQAGPDHDVLKALTQRRLTDLPRLVPEPGQEDQQVARELAAALVHLRTVHGSYWQRDWRRDHRGLGRYPEHELWEAVQGYLELLDAADPAEGDGFSSVCRCG